MDLKQEKSKLQKVEYRLKSCLQKAGKEKLAYSPCNNVTQYYMVVDGKRKYLSKKKDREMICKLAQERYAAKVLPEVEKLKKAINSFIADYDASKLEAIYNQMPDELKEYTVSYTPDYDEYGEEWANREYRRKTPPENPDYKTDNGEIVRSKSELIIANKLKSMGLKYRYENARLIKGLGTVYPDFTILDPNTGEEVILEHFGLMDDEDYLDRSFFRKMIAYACNGIVPGKGLICTFETGNRPLNVEYLENLLNCYFRKN